LTSALREIAVRSLSIAVLADHIVYRGNYAVAPPWHSRR